jgi:glucose/arabinose dehydrogenase
MPVSCSRPSDGSVFFCFALAVAISLTPRAAHSFLPDDVTTRNFFGAGVTFNRPTVVLDIPGTDSVYLVLEQTGGMVRMEHDGTGWVKHRFDSVHVTGVNGVANPRGPGEGNPGGMTDDGGLMGLAFHPDYVNNRKYYIKYVDPAYPGGTMWPGTIVIAERTADSTLVTGSGEPQRVVLALAKPFIWHSGGTLRYGADRYLYTAIGDGGRGGDPGNRAQDPGTLHGKMLRVDVDGEDAFPEDTTRNYAIPPGNPFVEESGFLPEIWALGLRSPWRWDFHPETGEIWLGDVGQTTPQKVTIVPKGSNLGWKIWEGYHCFSAPCDWADFTRPVLDLERHESISISGGLFFVGEPETAYDGLYIFGDYGRSRVWAMNVANDTVVERTQIATVFAVVSFNQDRFGQLQAVSIRSSSGWEGTGTVQVIESSHMVPVSVRHPRPIAGRATHGARGLIRASDVRRDPSRYEIRTLDGRAIHGTPSGTVLVRERNVSSHPQLLHFVH